jgi:hypothetical protein
VNSQRLRLRIVVAGILVGYAVSRLIVAAPVAGISLVIAIVVLVVYTRSRWGGTGRV